VSDDGQLSSRHTSVVKILGKEYRLSGDEDAVHMEAVAACLDRVLREIQATLPDTQDVAMLAALNLASSLVSLRSSLLLDSKRIRSLIDLVDSV
jgi:cell division protein ZapA (FtsZ GTPase activity inhibitor)